MALQEVVSLEADITLSLGKLNKKTGKTDPKSVEGYYLGNREVDTKLGKSLIHFFQTSKGNVGVWGATDLNRRLASVSPGTMAKAEFVGTKPTPRGDMRAFKVYQDKANFIDVEVNTEAPVAYDDAASSYDNTNDSEDDSSDSSYEANDDLPQGNTYVAAPTLQASTANKTTALERAAKVQALLNRNKK